MAIATVTFAASWPNSEVAHSAASETLITPPPPSVSINAPQEVLIGEDFTFIVEFSNSGPAGLNPFVDIVLDSGGADLNAPAPSSTTPLQCDGIRFVSATVVGIAGNPSLPLPPTPASPPLTAPCTSITSPVNHPFGSSNGLGPLTLPAGAQLSTIDLPFSSFQTNQAPVKIAITAHVDNYADQNHLLTIYTRSGFRGGTPSVSDSNPMVAGWSQTAAVKPVVFTFAVEDRLSPTPGSCFDGVDNGNDGQTDADDPDCKTSKAFTGEENETVSGPNFKNKYKIILNIANQMTVDKLTVQDCLPNNMVVTGIVTSPASTGYPTPQFGPTNTCTTFKFGTVTGGPGVKDIVIDIEFYVGEFDANGNRVLDEKCTDVKVVNTVSAEGLWTPLDPRDWQGNTTPTSQLVTTGGLLSGHTLTIKCMTIQKAVTPTPVKPGMTLNYVLKFQISDYVTIGKITIADFLADGQFVSSYGPVLVSDQFGVKSSFTFPSSARSDNLALAGASQLPCPPSLQQPAGGRILKFNLSQAMGNIPPNLPRLNAGILTGGYAAGSGPPNTPATGQIKFSAKILDQFASPVPSVSDKFVDKDDPINNCVAIAGTVYNNVNRPTPITLNWSIPTPTAAKTLDDSSTHKTVANDKFIKTIYAVNRPNVSLPGDTPICGPGAACSNFPSPPQQVHPGDKVTFRLEKWIPSGDAEDLVIEDWLPQPFFQVTGGSTFNNVVCSGGLPTINQACLGSTDTVHNIVASTVPAFTPDLTANSIKFDYKKFNDPSNAVRKIDLLYTTMVTGSPTGDKTLLTNQARECESSTFDATPICAVSVAQVLLREPELVIRKAVVAADNPNAIFSPAQQLPLGVGIGTNGFTGQITGGSGGNVGAINSNVLNVDANDIVTFAITVENKGGSPAYQVNIEDLIPNNSNVPTCFKVLPNSIRVQNGLGTILSAYSSPPTASGGFLVVPGSSFFPVNIGASTGSAGLNILVITFQVQMLSTVKPGCCDNTARLTKYTSIFLGGGNFVPSPSTPAFEDKANICVEPKLTKAILSTSEAHTNTSSGVPNVAIGEIVRYRLATQIPEGGVLSNFKVSDALPPGLKFLNDNSARIAFVSNTGITRSSALSATAYNNTTVPSFSALLGSPPIPTGGSPPVISGAAACGSPVDFDLGNVQNLDSDWDPESVIIDFNALVCNEIGNQDSSPPLPNQFTVSFTGGAYTSPSVNVKIVEPVLKVDKTAGPMINGVASFSVKVTNTGTADAFDVEVKDPLLSVGLASPTNVAAVGSSSSCTPPTPSVNITAISVIGSASSPFSIPVGCVVTLTFQARVTKPCSVQVINKATATYTSLPGLGTPKTTILTPTANDTGSQTPGGSGSSDGERNGTTAPLMLNDYLKDGSKTVNGSCESGTLKVQKKVEAAPPYNPPTGVLFPVTISCTPTGSTSPATTSVFNLSSTSPASLTIQPGSTCSVSEQLPPPITVSGCASLGWATPVYSINPLSIPIGLGSSSITIINSYRCLQ